MNIRSLRICSVPIRISSPELQVSVTCFLHELHILERYVTFTYRLHDLHKCAQGGYVTTTIFNIQLMEYDALFELSVY